MKFHESGLHFTFSPAWVVKKYDEHAYFRGLSGAGLKGVDFIAIYEGRELILIEVKNYRTRHNAGMDRSFEVTAKPVAELAAEIRRKTEDTLLAIDAVRQYYRRSWWYRRLLPLWRRWPWEQHNRAFWTRVDELADRRLHVVLWLALDDDDPQDYIIKLEQALRQQLSDLADQVSLVEEDQPAWGISVNGTKS